MLICTKCGGNEIESLVWIDNTTGEITQSLDEYYCRHCDARTGIEVVNDPSWIEDTDILYPENGDDETPT